MLSVDIEADGDVEAYHRLGHVMIDTVGLNVEGAVSPHVLSSSIVVTEEFGLPNMTEVCDVVYNDEEDDIE